MTDFGAPSFVRNIFDIPRQLTKLTIPRAFMKEYPSIFSDDYIRSAYLKVPGGLEYKAAVERKSGDILFSNGWRDFADHYALDSGYFLVFYYQGSSRFHVGIPLIARSTTLSSIVNAPTTTARKPKKKKKLRKKKALKRVQTKIRKDFICEALERAELHKCDDPSFIVSMSNLVYCGQWVPLVHGHRYLKKGYSKAKLVVERADGVTATCKVKVRSALSCVRLCDGWTTFMELNRLEVDDVCKFELVNRKNHTYMVHIFCVRGH